MHFRHQFISYRQCLSQLSKTWIRWPSQSSMKNESNLQNAKDYARIVYRDDVKFFPFFFFSSGIFWKSGWANWSECACCPILNSRTDRQKTTTHTIGFSNYPPTKKCFSFFFPDVFGCNFSFSFSKTEMKKSHDIFILVSMALFWSKSMDDGKSDSISWINPIDQSAFIIRLLSFLLYSSRKVLYWTSSRPPYSRSTIKQMHTVFKKTLNLTICLKKTQKTKRKRENVKQVL